jgi:hypothetical protein
MASSRRYAAPPAGSDLNPEDFNYFRTARWRVNDTFNLGNAQNVYQRQVANNDNQRARQNLTRQFGTMRQGLHKGFGSRGLLNSGIWQNRLAQFSQGRQAAYGDLAGEFADQLAGFRLAGQQLESTRTNAQADINVQEAARRAAIRAALDAAGVGR